ncbi:MAG: tetratricopeptide repeat protein [bacterium]|nr:tetratricopeptide repeat protein [bacterium]
MISPQADTLLLFGAGLLAGFFVGRFLRRKGASSALDESRRTSYYKSLNYILSNEHDKAIEEFTRMVEVDSETVEVYLSLGSLFRSKGEVGRAIRIHQSIIVRPGLEKKIKVQAYFDLALDYQKAGLFDNAIETFKTVVQLNPRHVKAYQQLEKIYEDEKSWDLAFDTQKQIQKLTKSKETMILAHLQTEKAKALYQAGRLEEAVRAFRKAIQIDSGCVDAHLHLGDLYHNERNYRKAIKIWEGVAERTPQYAFLTYKRLESSYAELGQYDKMEGIYEKNARLNPEDVQTRLVLGNYFLEKSELEKGINVFQEILEINPKCIEAHEKLAEAFLAQGKSDDVREKLRTLVEIFSEKYLFYHCGQCGFESKGILWRCPQCKSWNTFGCT